MQAREPNTVSEIAAAVRDGRQSARAVTQHTLATISELDEQVGAFQVLRSEKALAEAASVDARPDKGSLPLAGVPIPVKDNVPVAGEPMRDGSAGSDSAPQQRDHPIVARLRSAGAVIVGITRVPELCVFGATDSVFGLTRNPWQRDRTPGGSSGGAAAAVAAGMVPAAHGNDGMGSIRIPAACCGLVGVKPGLGVVPAEIGNGSWFDMAENGVLATTVADAALVLSVLAGAPELATMGELPPLRIAVATKAPAAGTPVNSQWAEAARLTGQLLANAGHTVSSATPRYGATLAFTGLSYWTAGTELDARIIADRTRLEPRVARHATVGRLLLQARLVREQGREQWRRRAREFFGEHDVLVTPTLAQFPLPSVEWHRRGWLRNVLADARFAPFPAPWNLIGWPAIAVPVGHNPTGTPLSAQLVAPPGKEALLLAIAAQLEKLNPWPRVAPAARH